MEYADLIWFIFFIKRKIDPITVPNPVSNINNLKHYRHKKSM